MTTFRELGRKVKKQLSYIERNRYPHQMPVSKYISINGILKLIFILIGVRSSLSSPRDRERCVALWGQQNKHRNQLHNYCPHLVSPLPFPSILSPQKSGDATAPAAAASAELWWVHAFLFRGMQTTRFCLLNSLIFYTWKTKLKGKSQRTFQVLIPQNVAPTPISWLIQVMTHLCQQGRLPSCVTVPPVLDNNEIMLCKRVQ